MTVILWLGYNNDSDVELTVILLLGYNNDSDVELTAINNFNNDSDVELTAINNYNNDSDVELCNNNIVVDYFAYLGLWLDVCSRGSVSQERVTECRMTGRDTNTMSSFAEIRML